MRSEKSGALSAASATALICERRRTQFFERERRVDSAGMVEIAVDQTVEQMSNVEAPGSACGVRITNDVDRATVAQQVIELRIIFKLINPIQVD